MALPDRFGVIRRALLTTLITWLPLLILSLIQNRAFGDKVKIPFLYDFGAGLRFLVGLPLLVIAEAVIDPRLNRAVRHFSKSNLVAPSVLPAFEEVIRQTNRLRDHAVIVIPILLLAFLPSINLKQTELLKAGIASWHTIVSPSGESLSWAGRWAGFVSWPLFRILMLRWLWITCLWGFFLRRVSKLDLGCVGTHPDTCGGLGFLAETQLWFGFISFAVSVGIAGTFGNSIAYEGATVSSLKFLMIGFCVITVLVFALPLLVLSPKLAVTKRKSLHLYGTLATFYVQEFDAKWIRGLLPEQEALLGTGDIQSLADLNNSFAVVREMKVMLIDKKVLLGLAIPPVLPLVPLIFLATPADEITKAVFKLLL
ncbi:MAG TPA: hypothetical protein VH351_17240 [Bryobacteraceae bacterium]|nr:hypothetical protein [Bryobacteraceae bacterium]